MMDKTAIAHVIEDCDCAPRFLNYARHSHRAPRGDMRHYVHIVRGGCARSIGEFEVVAQMSEAELRAHIAYVASKFAPRTAQ